MDFDQDVIVGNAMKNKHKKTTVNEGTADQEFTVRFSESVQAVDEIVVNVKSLERCVIERFDREMGNIVNTVGDWILTARDSNFTPEPNQLLGHLTHHLDGI